MDTASTKKPIRREADFWTPDGYVEARKPRVGQPRRSQKRDRRSTRPRGPNSTVHDPHRASRVNQVVHITNARMDMDFDGTQTLKAR